MPSNPVILLSGENGLQVVPTLSGFTPPQVAEEMVPTQATDLATYEAARVYQNNLKRIIQKEELEMSDALNTSREWWRMAADQHRTVNAITNQHLANLSALSQGALAASLQQIGVGAAVGSMATLENVGMHSSQLLGLRAAEQVSPDVISAKLGLNFANQIADATVASSLAGKLSADMLAQIREMAND